MQSARTLDLLRIGPGERVQLEPEIAKPHVIARLIASFANTQGGTIVFGAHKRGQVVGLRDAHQAAAIITHAADLIAPNILIEPYIVVLDEHEVILVEVPRGSDAPYTTPDGRIWVRKGARIVQARAEQAHELAERAIVGATMMSYNMRGTTGRLHSKTITAPTVDLDHIMLKLERLIIANAELARKLDESNSWRSRITDQVIGAVLGLAISIFVFYVLGIG